MTNRVADLIGRYEIRIEKLGGEDGIGLDGRPVAKLHDDMALTWNEFRQFQNLQAESHAQGLLSIDEASIIYHALGGESFSPNWAPGTSVATKTAITQIMGELIQRRIKR